jgi:hypothetical protein
LARAGADRKREVQQRDDSDGLLSRQARQLARLYGLSYQWAATLAPIVYAVAR